MLSGKANPKQISAEGKKNSNQSRDELAKIAGISH